MRVYLCVWELFLIFKRPTGGAAAARGWTDGGFNGRITVLQKAISYSIARGANTAKRTDITPSYKKWDLYVSTSTYLY